MCKFFRLVAILAFGLQLGGCLNDFGPIAAVPEPVAPVTAVATASSQETSLR